MYSTRIVVDIIECLAHRNIAVRLKAEKLTDISKNYTHAHIHTVHTQYIHVRMLTVTFLCVATVLEFDRKVSGEPGQLGQEIIRKRFESHNKVPFITSKPLLSSKSFALKPVRAPL